MKSSILALIDKITIVVTDNDLQRLLMIMRDMAATRPIRVAFVNAHAINMCYQNPGFLQDLMACDFILRDGSGMKILYKLLGREAGLNLNGTDLIPRIIDLYKGQPIALMGTSSPYLEQAGDLIASQGGIVAGAIDGFQDTNAYTITADRAQASLVILAMGMPKQENVASYLSKNLNHGCLIICGGAILDFLGGKVTRAPQFFRKVGMEWLYRLLIEPKRLFGRYVIGNGIFLYRGLILALQLKQARDRV